MLFTGVPVEPQTHPKGYIHMERDQSDERITMLLPFYHGEGFSELYEAIGFRTIWAETKEELEEKLDGEQPDIALEWPHGPLDFPIRDMLKKRNLKTPILLCNNYTIREDHLSIGFVGILDVTQDIHEIINAIVCILPDSKREQINRIKENLDASKKEKRDIRVLSSLKNGRITYH